MSKFIKAITVVASLFAAGSALADDCGHLAFYGKTMNGKKEVSVCFFSKGNTNFIKYNFGKVGEKPELEIIKPAYTAEYTIYKPHGAYGYELTVHNGVYDYILSSGMNDEGAEYGSLDVKKSGKEIAEIKLNTATTSTNFSFIDDSGYHKLNAFGIPDWRENEGDYPEATHLAPRLTK